MKAKQNTKLNKQIENPCHSGLFHAFSSSQFGLAQLINCDVDVAMFAWWVMCVETLCHYGSAAAAADSRFRFDFAIACAVRRCTAIFVKSFYSPIHWKAILVRIKVLCNQIKEFSYSREFGVWIRCDILAIGKWNCWTDRQHRKLLV